MKAENIKIDKSTATIDIYCDNKKGVIVAKAMFDIDIGKHNKNDLKEAIDALANGKISVIRVNDINEIKGEQYV